MIRLPLAGSTLNHDIFQYILLDASQKGCLIAIPPWIVHKPLESRNTFFHLYLPTQQARPLQGAAELIDFDKGGWGALYQVTFEKGDPLFINSPKEASLPLFLQKIIKDCLLIKSAIAIYLHHLSAFFSRIVEVADEKYRKIDTFVIQDIERQLQHKISEFARIYRKLEPEQLTLSHLPFLLNFEELLLLVRSEIDIDLFQLAFDALLDYKEPPTTVSHYSITSYRAYLDSIKLLEQRLYVNYNRITLSFPLEFKLVGTTLSGYGPSQKNSSR